MAGGTETPTDVSFRSTYNGKVTLNIEPALTISVTRETLVRDLIAELTAWNPRERRAAFKQWHDGAVSLIHLNVLALLEAEGPLSMTRLADGLDVSVASATGIIDRMEKRGLVTRHHDTDDRRVVQVQAAERGIGMFDHVDGQRRAHLERLAQELSDEELSGFLVGLRALRAARMRLMDAMPEPVP